MKSYFFLLSLIKCPITDIESYAMEIGDKYRQLKIPIKFGEKQLTNTRGYGYGEQEDLIEKLQYFCNLFPKAIFAFHHFYYNCQTLTSYTIIQKKVYIGKHSLENIPVGNYNITTSYSLEDTEVPNNITSYLNPNYPRPFEENLDVFLNSLECLTHNQYIL